MSFHAILSLVFLWGTIVTWRMTLRDSPSAPIGSGFHSAKGVKYRAVGRPYHQRCTDDGIEAELTADGFLRCEDTFTNKQTGAECKVNPDTQRGFVCKQKK
jgi:hypothetical protein